MQGTNSPSSLEFCRADRLVTVIRYFWRRTQKYILPQGARYAPRPPLQSCWRRPGRRLSGSSWTFPLSRASKEQPPSSAGMFLFDVSLLRADPRSNLSKQGDEVTRPIQQCVRMSLFTRTYFETHLMLRGVMPPPPDILTTEGYDTTFGTSVLGQSLCRILDIAEVFRCSE